MIKLKKLILASMVLGFSGLSAAHVNQNIDTFAEGVRHKYCGGLSPLLTGLDDFHQSAYLDHSDVDLGDLRGEFVPPAIKRPITIGLVIDDEIELMPKPISAEACEVTDICRLFVLPRS